jgi:hypothetical protein
VEFNPLVGPKRVRSKLAAHSNEFPTVNKDGFSFMNVRAALSCIGKPVFLYIKLAQNGVLTSQLLPLVNFELEAIIKN